MAVSIADIWKPYETRKISIHGDFTRLVIRKRGVRRQSKKVMDVNDQLAKAAKECKGKKGKEFQRCVAGKVHPVH